MPHLTLTTSIVLALIDAGKVLLLAIALIWYRQNRRFRADRKGGLNLWGFLDHNVTELILGVAIVPSLVNLAGFFHV